MTSRSSNDVQTVQLFLRVRQDPGQLVHLPEQGIDDVVQGSGALDWSPTPSCTIQDREHGMQSHSLGDASGLGHPACWPGGFQFDQLLPLSPAPPHGWFARGPLPVQQELLRGRGELHVLVVHLRAMDASALLLLSPKSLTYGLIVVPGQVWTVCYVDPCRRP